MVNIKMLAVVILAATALPTLANGFGEDRPYQFTNSFEKQYLLNSAIAMESKKSSAFGTAYISNTSIGNQVIVGDNSNVDNTTIGQENHDSQQNAVGASLDDNGTVSVGAQIGGGQGGNHDDGEG